MNKFEQPPSYLIRVVCPHCGIAFRIALDKQKTEMERLRSENARLRKLIDDAKKLGGFFDIFAGHF